MSADKRTPHTDALDTLGMVHTQDEYRDAIHLAVEPVTATERLYPGQDIGLVEGGAGACEAPIGIVDPFLKHPVEKGDRFWLVIYPREITSLRHVWTHPAIEKHEEDSSKEASAQWLANYAADLDVSIGDLVDAAERSNDGDWVYLAGLSDGRDIRDGFWTHMENYMGKRYENKVDWFSCSC